MNISFNVKKTKVIEDSVKEQINFYKLHIEEDDRYFTGFDVFQDDNKIICYVNEHEIQLTYDGIKLTDIECETDEESIKKLKLLLNKDKTICENLLELNAYLTKIENENMVEEPLPYASRRDKFNSRVSNQLNKVFEDDNSDIFNDMDDSSDTSSEVEDVKEIIEVKDVKPIKFDFNIQPKVIIPDLSDDIILFEELIDDNYISCEVINKSKQMCSNATVYQLVNEITKAIKNTKNIIIKPVNSVFEISIENKFNKNELNYHINIPIKYPFVPPSISIKSNFNQSFTYAINNCEILNEAKWNPSTTLEDIIKGIYDNVSKLDFDSLKSKITDPEFFELSTQLLELTNTSPLDSNTYDLNFDFLKIQDKVASRGIGYDCNNTNKWNVTSYLREQKSKSDKIVNILTRIRPIISKNKEFISDTCIIPYIRQYLYGVSIFEVEQNKEYYEILFEVFNEIYKLEKFNSHFNLDKICEQRDTFSEYPKIFNSIPIIEKVLVEVDKNDYVSFMKEEGFQFINIIGNKRYKFMAKIKDSNVGSDFMRRVQREIKDLHNEIPNTLITENSSIFFRVDESNMSVMKFLIIPHPDGPYAYGCFEFDIHIPSNYPAVPPHVEIITTGFGEFRFNPNLYDNGKVCLSLLGTWSGTEGEIWNPQKSTIYQVLTSIQGLIFCEEPYFNEPGYEKNRDTKAGKELNEKYNEPIRFQTMRLGMLNQLKSPSFGFEDVINNHFRMHKDKIYKKLDDWEKIAIDKIKFNKVYNDLKCLMNKL
jgi:ubiquitin-protein ligase